MTLKTKEYCEVETATRRKVSTTIKFQLVFDAACAANFLLPSMPWKIGNIPLWFFKGASCEILIKDVRRKRTVCKQNF